MPNERCIVSYILILFARIKPIQLNYKDGYILHKNLLNVLQCF